MQRSACAVEPLILTVSFSSGTPKVFIIVVEPKQFTKFINPTGTNA